VFGDGDPNAGLADSCVRAAAAVVRKNGGAVTHEQLLPFLPSPPTRRVPSGLGSSVVDEQSVLPVVSTLQGVPAVTDQGDIVYTFDEVVLTASAGGADDAPEGYIQEAVVPFSQASPMNLALAGTLGALNLLGSIFLGLQLAALPIGVALPGVYGLIQAIYPLILAFAVVFNAAPLLRYLSIGATNAAIAERNDARRLAAFALQAPGGDLKVTASLRLRSSRRSSRQSLTLWRLPPWPCAAQT
jgi:hypothetical protein